MNNLLTWEQAISTFSSSLSSNHLSQKTRREYIAIVKDVRSFVLAKFSLENPTQITSYHLVSFIREYTHIDFSSDLSLIRINRKKKALCLFFDQLVKQGEILENPSSDIRVHRIKKNHGFDNPFEIGNTRNQGLVPNKTNEDTAVPPAIKTVTAHEIKAHLDLKVV